MWFGVPIALIIAYMLFRLAEYYGLKAYQARAADVPTQDMRRGSALLLSILVPARMFGWAALIWFGVKSGLWDVLKLMVISFSLSLLIQIPYGLLLIRLGALGTLLNLAAVPVMALVIIAIIASL